MYKKFHIRILALIYPETPIPSDLSIEKKGEILRKIV